MKTINTLTREALERLVLRLAEKTKVFILSGRDHRRVHAVTLRAIRAMVGAPR